MAVPTPGPGNGGQRPPGRPPTGLPPQPFPAPPSGAVPPQVPGARPPLPANLPPQPVPSGNMPPRPGMPQPPGVKLPSSVVPPAVPGARPPSPGNMPGGPTIFPSLAPPSGPPRPTTGNVPTGNVPPGNVPPAAPRPMPVPPKKPSAAPKPAVPPTPAPPQPVNTPATPAAAPAAPRKLPSNAPRPVTKSPLKPPIDALPKPADEPEEELSAQEELVATLKKNSMPLLVSFGLHMMLIIVLGLMTVHIRKNAGIVLNAAIGTPGEVALAEVRSLDFAQTSLEATDQRPLFNPTNTVAVKVNVPVSPFGVGKVALDTSNISSTPALAGRGMKGKLLGAFGGNQETEDAVSLGLVWLAKHQLPTGLWSLTGEGKAPIYSKGSSYENQEAATAMALLAFLGAGHTHKSGSHAEVVNKGLHALLRLQDPKGNFFRGQRADDALYSQAQCTMAMCELLALSNDSAIREPCERAVKYCLDAQDPTLGGWRYTPRSDSDTSVTGWMVMALQSAKNAGIAVPQEKLDLISHYLDKAAMGLGSVMDARTTTVTIATPGAKSMLPPGFGSRYAYQPGMDFDRVMTAEGLLCRMYLGWPHDDPRLTQGCTLLLDHLPEWRDRDVYYWYYATQTMFHMEGKFWDAWNKRLRDMLTMRQEQNGPERGSWDPLDNEGPDLWSMNKHGGRLYVTCFSIFMLEVYYRHLPLYGELKKQMEKKK